jgi:hypothetical protein
MKRGRQSYHDRLAADLRKIRSSLISVAANLSGNNPKFGPSLAISAAESGKALAEGLLNDLSQTAVCAGYVAIDADPVAAAKRQADEGTGTGLSGIGEFRKEARPSLVVRLRFDLDRDRFVTICERDNGAVDVVFHGEEPAGNALQSKGGEP